MKTHREEKDIPTSLAERKDRIDWLSSHEVWSWGYTFTNHGIHNSIDIELVYVNPDTEEIDDDDEKNTETRVWIEAGPKYDMSLEPDIGEPEGGWNDFNCWGNTHDIKLDCGGKTLEEAYLKLAALIEVFYNDDGTSKGLWWCKEDCHSHDGKFCYECGFAMEEE